MSLAKASLWTAASTLVKIGAGLLVGKLLAVSFGPAGLGLAANFRQLITVLGVLAGAGIFNGVPKYVAQYHDNPQQLRRGRHFISDGTWLLYANGAGFCAGSSANQPGIVW